MAGKLQLAAKLFLGTAVLASGGSGVYYASSHGWSLPGLNHGSTQTKSPELDAVASAWADSPSAKSDASPKAPTPTPTDKLPAAKASTDDRYAVKATTPSKSDSKDETKPATSKKESNEIAKQEAAAPTPPETSNAKEPEPVAIAGTIDDETTSDKNTPDKKPENSKIAVPAPEAPVARGQEPKDDQPISVPVKTGSADLGAIFEGAPKDGSSPKEPKPLPAPQQRPSSLDTTRAKQAFGTSQPAVSAADRYGNGVPAAVESNALPKTVSTNPFGPKPTSSPSATPSQPNRELIQPLRSGSDNSGSSFADPQPPVAQPSTSAPASNYPSRSASRDFSSSKYRSAPSASSGNTSNTDIGPLPPVPGSISVGAADPIGAPTTSGTGSGTGKPGEKALEGPQQPTLVIQKFAPGEIQVGKPAKFVLQVRNAGNQAADNVTVQDDIPQGTQLISTAPNASNDGSRLVWQLGKLSPGEDRTVEMRVMPKAEGDIGSVATVTYSAQASVKTHCTMPQLAIRMTAPSEVMIGAQQHVKIEVRNSGSGDATGVMLFENVPPNVKHVAGPSLEFEIGTLRAGETRELDLVLSAEKAGKVTNTLTARAQGNLQVQQQVEFEVIAPALSVAVQGPDRRYLERPATYEVSVQNPGTAPAHDVQIVTKLPKGMRFVKANNMGEYDAANHAVYWSLAELPKGEKGTVELTAMPIEPGQQTLQVESHAQQGLADKTQRDVLVEGLAAIKFEVKALEDPIEVGGETGYEIRVLNQGTKAAANVQVTAELPAGLKLVSAEGETQHRVDQNHLVFEPLPQLAPKADTVFRIRAQGIQPGDQRIVVEVKTDDLQNPIRREESTRVFGDQ